MEPETGREDAVPGSRSGRSRTRKPYVTPRLTEHGTIAAAHPAGTSSTTAAIGA